MKYKISEHGKARIDFAACFPVPIGSIYDGLATMIFGCIQIDVFKFDEYLHEKHGEYEENGKSMKDVVLEHYGERALRVFEALLPPEDGKLNERCFKFSKENEFAKQGEIFI